MCFMVSFTHCVGDFIFIGMLSKWILKFHWQIWVKRNFRLNLETTSSSVTSQKLSLISKKHFSFLCEARRLARKPENFVSLPFSNAKAKNIALKAVGKEKLLKIKLIID